MLGSHPHRDQLVKEVREILKNAGVTSILVTHDEVEAENFADKVGIIDKKKLLIKWKYVSYANDSDYHLQ